LTVVGLGPGDPDMLTVGARAALEAAARVWARTLRHPTFDALDLGDRLRSFDDLYDRLASVEEVYATIARRLVEVARAEPELELVYAVPGSPGVGERSVALLRREAEAAGVALRILPGVSALEASWLELGVDPIVTGLQAVDAPELATLLEERPSVASQFLNPTLPLLVGGVWNLALASAVKLFLLPLYGAGWRVRLARAGLGESPLEVSLEELDRGAPLDHLTTLYVPPVARDAPGPGFYTLTHIIARLRGPGGCPWDREQTHASLKRYLLEEAYEAVGALDADDPYALEEELGDVLLQVSLHSEIAHSEAEFDVGDVIRGLTSKLVRRHPHVFGETRADDAAQVVANWQEIKRGEREERGEVEGSALEGVPEALPALARAQSVSHRAAKTGFDWADREEVLAKVREELEELERAGPAERREELGDLLFVLVNWARFSGLEAEEALRLATLKFERRFRELERRAGEGGEDIRALSARRLDDIWNEVKAAERSALGDLADR
jgi:tetrapyrrole methylase family protein/MazG family protein